MPARTAFDAASLTNDDLRAAVDVARQRLPHEEICDHCARAKQDSHESAVSLRRVVAEFNERAARAGFVASSKSGLVHRWDCSSIQNYLNQVSSTLERHSIEDLGESIDRGYDPSLPMVLTAEQARVFLEGSRARRRCVTCSPDA